MQKHWRNLRAYLRSPDFDQLIVKTIAVLWFGGTALCWALANGPEPNEDSGAEPASERGIPLPPCGRPVMDFGDTAPTHRGSLLTSLTATGTTSLLASHGL
jgi:hypothetical protein